MSISDYIAQDFGTFDTLFRLQVDAAPDQLAVICDGKSITYRALDELVDRLAATLQRDGVKLEGVVSICASSSILYTAVFMATLRAGAIIAPLSPSSTDEQLLAMVEDCGASHFFTDKGVSNALVKVSSRIKAKRIALEEGAEGIGFDAWLAPLGSVPKPVTVSPDQGFNIIYSSGTTGTPKGIVQSHRMRWAHIMRIDMSGTNSPDVTILSTPLYSNTTLVRFLPALAGGGTVVLMAKFDALKFLELCQAHRVTSAMLVPVQYRRILDVPTFDSFDLSSFRMKFCTSAPFSAELKAEILRRWPGGLIEFYGMTEGGGSCMLVAHEFPDKLHTVGRPIPGHDIKLIDDAGNILGVGQPGEVVGRSVAMMNGYHNRPDKTSEAEWWSADGQRYIRTGDIAVMDEDGFFTLIGRKKDMIISGGINIYPVDLEQVLCTHPDVKEVAVVGAPSAQWGETPVAFVTVNPDSTVDSVSLLNFANAQLGKMQRISEVRIVDALPRSAIGKILKRELQDQLKSIQA
jgi:acyl-CoA synthetase (AMP-forming)/AMP-acid ligase II